MIGRTVSHYRITSKLGSGNDGTWARRDPDLAIVHGEAEFERLYPPAATD